MAIISNSKNKMRKLSAAVFAATLLAGLAVDLSSAFAQPSGDRYYYYHRHRHHRKIYPGVDFGFVYGNNGNATVIHRRGQPCVATAMGSSHPLC